MKLISTIVGDSKYAKKILAEIPENSVILFPESLSLSGTIVKKYSQERDLFIIYNSDTKENGKHFISMRGVDNGEEVWRVRKFNLWHSDKIDGFDAPRKPEPLVHIRNMNAGVFICYDAVKIFQMKEMLIQNKIEVLLIPANWHFNFKLIQRIIDFSMKYIPTLYCTIFSNIW